MGRARELARMMGTLSLVVGAAVGVLVVLDWLPRAGAPPLPARPFQSVEELERATRQRLVLPAYFPQSLRWPPTSIRTAGRPPAAVVLGFSGRDGGPERLLVAQTLGGRGALPAHLLPEGVVLEEREVQVGGAPAHHARLLGQDGVGWHELRWEGQGRTLALRSRGSLTELVRMAESVRGGQR